MRKESADPGADHDARSDHPCADLGIAGYKLGLYFSDREFFNNDTEGALMSLKGLLAHWLVAPGWRAWKYMEFKKEGLGGQV
ncbi:MAG: hypothetical protein IPN95_16320 [Bacteroidetes bacterium]|nr:hypothetical protein [Bacteroidota bacterium]